MTRRRHRLQCPAVAVDDFAVFHLEPGDSLLFDDVFVVQQAHSDHRDFFDKMVERGVVLIGHHETSGNAAHYESQLDAAFDLYQRVGVPAVKTGYVADASQAKVTGTDGKRHYAWHEGQDMARHHLKVVTEAAKRRFDAAGISMPFPQREVRPLPAKS